jgi:endonuclease/exonuclease/phosphatase family metal-dependent hydrolase
MAIFTQKDIEVLDSGRLNLYKNTTKDAGFASYITFKYGSKAINLLNIHGKANPGHKKDTPARLRQSEKIINFFANKSGPKIIGGDFNLNPDTKSVKMFEEARYRNLIKEFGIKSTRNTLAWEKYKNVPGYFKQYFADFCFVSPEVKVNSFEVPDVEVSDHLPMILDSET